MASRRYRAKNSLNSNISQVNARISQISKRPSPRKIATNSISSVQIRDATIISTNLDRGSVTNEKLAADAVRTGNIEDGAVTSAKIAPGVLETTVNLTDTTKTSGILPVSRGGTGGGDAAAARTGIGAAATSHTHTASQITDFSTAVNNAVNTSSLANFAQGVEGVAGGSGTVTSSSTISFGFNGIMLANPSTSVPGVVSAFGVVQGGTSAVIYVLRSNATTTNFYWAAFGE